MPRLFEPLPIGPLTLRNRIVVAPMCQYMSRDGEAGDWHAVHWGTLALSGAGLVIVEATAVSPQGRISWADLGLWDDRTQAAIARALAVARRNADVPFGIQLAHAGRKGACRQPWDAGGAPLAADDPRAWPVVSASALAYADGHPLPQALDAAGIERVVADFAAAARRAVALGFDLIELHMAHGYLLHQFLSPLSNQRSDAWGGPLEHRLRLPLAVFEAVRAAIPAQVALGVRISASDWVEGGWDLAQSAALARALDDRGCDYLHVSGGGLDPHQRIPLGPGYQVPFAAALRREVAMPVVAVGLITEPVQAETIVSSGQADAVALARGLLWNPRWPWHAAAALGAQADCPPSYLRAAPHAPGVLRPPPSA